MHTCEVPVKGPSATTLSVAGSEPMPHSYPRMAELGVSNSVKLNGKRLVLVQYGGTSTLRESSLECYALP